jgi:uncharacterized protein (TIGR02246 family)
MLADSQPNGQAGAIAVYRDLITAWNRRDAVAMAALFLEDGDVTGFDGSMLSGASEIQSSMAAIFAEHQTPPYVAKVRGVRLLQEGVAVVRGVAGMALAGTRELDPGLNAVQTLVAIRNGAGWRIASFQTTPAAFHGRPDAVVKLTRELQDHAAHGGLPEA